MGPSYALEVADWAALISSDSVEQLGAAEGPECIPSQYRRRLPAFARDAARCALPVLRVDPTAPVVFSSVNGDLPSAATLLSDLARKELLSPALFSMSVHNAPAGVLGLCLSEHGDHTAIAGASATLPAALLECYARLLEDDVDSVVLIHADDRMPPIYAQFDEDTPGAFLTLRLRRATAVDATVQVTPGRTGAVALARSLQNGARQLSFLASFAGVAA